MLVTDPSEFTIQRSKWLRGCGHKTALVYYGKYDCLGFLLLEAGLSDYDMRGCEEPTDVARNHEWLGSKLVDWCGSVCMKTHLCSSIISVNDDPVMASAEREMRLGELFADAGIKVKFVD